MPIDIHTPKRKDYSLTNDCLERVLKAIDRTHKERIEFGFPLCATTDKDVEAGELCEGDICAIEVKKCPPGQKSVGSVHTHPEGRADFSPADYITSLTEGADIGCVWGRIDNRLVCVSPRRKIEKKELVSFEKRYAEVASLFEEWSMTGREPTNGRRTEIVKLAKELEGLFSTVLETDRAGVAEAIIRPKKLKLEECLTFYSHLQVAERARKAGISTQGGKKTVCERLIKAGVL